MANVKAAMEYAQTFEREAMEKRLAESDLEAPTLVDVVVRHEQEIQELKRLVTPMMEFKQEQLTTMGMHCRRIEQERDHVVEALRAIANPIAAMQKAVPKGHLFSGAMAVQIAADPAYYQGIAQDALDEIERSL